MAKGTVKSVTDKGYGFIKTPDSPDKDVFYHESGLTGALATRKLKEGDDVEFDIVRNDRGLNAENIKLAGSNEEETQEEEEEEAA